MESLDKIPEGLAAAQCGVNAKLSQADWKLFPAFYHDGHEEFDVCTWE